MRMLRAIHAIANAGVRLCQDLLPDPYFSILFFLFLPIRENAERQFIATGYCGNGITFGTIVAMMARDWATDRKNPWRELFAADRKKSGARLGIT
jgi:hypothetical protein